MNWFLLLVDYFQDCYHLSDADKLFESLYKVIVDDNLLREDILYSVVEYYNKLLQS